MARVRKFWRQRDARSPLRQLSGVRLFALLLVVMLAAVACASDDEAADSAAEDTDAAEEEPAEEEPAEEEPAEEEPAEEEPVETATIRLAPWGPALIDFVDLYVAQENGYFADEGIELEQLPAEGAGDAVRNVIAGNADIAMADPFSGFLANAQGADLQGFYCPYTENWMTMVVDTSEGINEPEDLAGQTIAVTSLASTSRYYAGFLLNDAGLTEDDVNMVTVGRDFGSALVADRADSASSWGSANWGMFEGGAIPEDQQDQYTIWPYSDLIAGPNDVYFAERSWVQENPDVVQRFVRAIDQAKQFVADNPEEAVEIGQQYAVTADDNPDRDRAVIDMRIQMQANGPGVAENGRGWCDVPTMQEIVDRSVELGFMEETIDVESTVTNEFLSGL